VALINARLLNGLYDKKYNQRLLKLTVNKELLALTKQARKECLKNLGYTEENQKSAKNLLLGRCKSNSKVLRKVLENNGYNPEIGGGVLRAGAWKRRDEIESFQDAIRQREPIHYWVRVNGHICEVASEADQYHGEPIAARIHPEQLGYIIFEDSYDGLEN